MGRRWTGASALGGLLAASCFLFGCSVGGEGVGGGVDGGGDPMCTLGDAFACDGDIAYRCEGGSTRDRTDCARLGQQCTSIGCAMCEPNAERCEERGLTRCNADGSALTVLAECAAGETCSLPAHGCVSLCAAAEVSRSYVGCEYWPVTTLNASLDSVFGFAVVVSNPHSIAAHVSVDRAGSSVTEIDVPPGAVETIELPYVTALARDSRHASSLVEGGAYHLVSSVPITVYQFNPLTFSDPGRCLDDAGEGPPCFSYSNDASLLLPTHVLTGNYIGVAYPTIRIEAVDERGTEPVSASGSFRGFLAITAVAEGETSVDVTFSAHVSASSDGRITSHAQGETATFELSRGDVLQLVADAPEGCVERGRTAFGPGVYVSHCEVGADYDLTGSVIRASRPVSVIGGNDCAFVPFDRYACDHLEESVFPEEAWGRDFAVSTADPSGETGPNLLRIVSGHDANRITFDPALSEPLDLDRGEVAEVTVDAAVSITGSAAFSVTQLLVGEQAHSARDGDPSMLFAIPTEQYRRDYAFLVPSTYSRSYVNVVVSGSAVLTLDAEPLDTLLFRPIGRSGLRAGRMAIEPGSHRLESSEPFGIVVYGFASYTSYAFPGGLDFLPINLI